MNPLYIYPDVYIVDTISNRKVSTTTSMIHGKVGFYKNSLYSIYATNTTLYRFHSFHTHRVSWDTITSEYTKMTFPTSIMSIATASGNTMIHFADRPFCMVSIDGKRSTYGNIASGGSFMTPSTYITAGTSMRLYDIRKSSPMYTISNITCTHAERMSHDICCGILRYDASNDGESYIHIHDIRARKQILHISLTKNMRIICATSTYVYLYYNSHIYRCSISCQHVKKMFAVEVGVHAMVYKDHWYIGQHTNKIVLYNEYDPTCKKSISCPHILDIQCIDGYIFAMLQ